MKKRHKIGILFSFLISLVMSVFLSCQNVNAIYDGTTSNKVISYEINKTENQVEVEVQYQYGMTNLVVYICDTTADCALANIKPKTTYVDSDLAMDQNDTSNENSLKYVVNRFSQKTVDTYTKTFSTPTSGEPLERYPEKFDEFGKPDNKYHLLVKARLCQIRTDDLNGCAGWSNELTTLISEEFDLSTGVTGSSEFNKTISEMLYITNSIVIPILWVVLGLLLIIRGIMLGIDIVKSADEPEVRSKKVHGLIWLFIGVFLGFVATISASYVMSMFGFGGVFK